jgi:hypothetical protein
MQVQSNRGLTAVPTLTPLRHCNKSHAHPRYSGDRIAWHYTSGRCAIQIVQTEVILPATENVPRGEKPAVWFSLNQSWEPTATKGILDPLTGSRRFATMDEMARLAGGCYRFGIDPSRLLCWSALKVKTRMRPKTVRALERVAYKFRSNPSDWMGAMEAVSLRDVVVLQKLIMGSWVSGPEQLVTDHNRNAPIRDGREIRLDGLSELSRTRHNLQPHSTPQPGRTRDEQSRLRPQARRPPSGGLHQSTDAQHL